MLDDDQILPIANAALLTAKVKHEYVILPREAHGFNKDENVVEFFRKVEKFLAENLK